MNLQRFIEIPGYETIIDINKISYIRSIEIDNPKIDLVKICIEGDTLEYEGKNLYSKISTLIKKLKKEELDKFKKNKI